MTGFIGVPLVEVKNMAEGVGNAPTSAMPILFSGQVQPAYICLPSTNGQGGPACGTASRFQAGPSAADNTP
jgi:hypothetical protein